MPEQRRQRMKNLTGVLLGLVLFLVGLVAFQYIEVRTLREAAYDRCVATAAQSTRVGASREIQVEEYRRLGELALVNPGLSEAMQNARRDSYNRMADSLEGLNRTVQHPADCDPLK